MEFRDYFHSALMERYVERVVDDFELDVEGEREVVSRGGWLCVFGDEDVVVCEGQLHF